MAEVIKVSDNFDLVDPSKYPYAKFPYEKFNVVQSRLFEFYDQDANVVIAAKTSAGKTVCAEMMLAHEVEKRGGKGMYLSPLKSLTNEKYDDWQEEEHHFSKKNISICTGDYLLTADRKEELEKSNLILMSSEMLNSRGRNQTSEKNNWLRGNVGTLAVDEAHLLTVPGRGDHLESGLIKYAKLNPQGRILLLSASMPNVEEIAEWISALTGKKTYLLNSDYRPCPLNMHYEKFYDDVYTYDDKQREMVNAAVRIIEEYPEDKFLIFTHTKKTGSLMLKELQSMNLKCEYHNADIEKKKRREIEAKFVKDKDMKYLVATSTLAWGRNLPARRVIILGAERGLAEVPTYDIQQMCGRAGRPQYDPCGDVYLLLPESKINDEIARLSKPQKIISQMLDEKNINHHKVLGFHLISEINSGDVSTREDVKTWFSSTLASYQAKELSKQIVDDTLKGLMNCGAIYETDGVLRATSIGKIASMFYYSPWDVSDLSRNFTRMFQKGKQFEDLHLAWALGNIDSFRFGIVSAAEKEEIGSFDAKLNKYGIKNESFSMAGSVKSSYAYFCLLNGINSQVFGNFVNGLRIDLGRLKEVLSALNYMAGKWDAKEYLQTLNLRLHYGVDNDLLSIIKLEGIGKVKARKLFDRGLKTYADIAKSVDKIILALNCTPKLAAKIAAEAAELAKAD